MSDPSHECAQAEVEVNVSPEGDKLITSGANYLNMSKKDFVEAAVAFYLDAAGGVDDGAAAVRRQIERDNLRELIEAHEAIHGEITEEEIQAVREEIYGPAQEDADS